MATGRCAAGARPEAGQILPSLRQGLRAGLQEDRTSKSTALLGLVYILKFTPKFHYEKKDFHHIKMPEHI
jgi:hypothetical protein